MTIESVQLRIAQIQQIGGAARSVGTARPSGSSFDDVLAGALDRSSPSDELTSHGVPKDLATYTNGRVPATALSRVGSTGHRMWKPAATALTRLISDAAAAGVTIQVTDSYRSYDSQVRVAREKGLYKNGGLAATPGTSNHGWGRSADLDLSPRAQRWMQDHAAIYGFAADVQREPWHWTYSPE